MYKKLGLYILSSSWAGGTYKIGNHPVDYYESKAKFVEFGKSKCEMLFQQRAVPIVIIDIRVRNSGEVILQIHVIDLQDEIHYDQ